MPFKALLSYNLLAHSKQISFLSGRCFPFDISSVPGVREGGSRELAPPKPIKVKGKLCQGLKTSFRRLSWDS